MPSNIFIYLMPPRYTSSQNLLSRYMYRCLDYENDSSLTISLMTCIISPITANVDIIITIYTLGINSREVNR